VEFRGEDHLGNKKCWQRVPKSEFLIVYLVALCCCRMVKKEERWETARS